MDSSTPRPPTPVIEMSDVRVGSRHDVEAVVLEAVDWSVVAGDYWVIGGLQGSGKSDLLAMTAGLTPPQGGSYRLFGRDMPMAGDQFLADRLRIGLVFDTGQLFHRLTIAENVALPLRYHRELAGAEFAQRIAAALELTNLAKWAERLPGMLGRGWQKRVGLARALVLEPEILLLDNPLAGLGGRQGQWWMGLLDELSRGHAFLGGRATTLVVTTEDLRPWRNRTASFAILEEGRFRPLGRHPELGKITEPLVRELLAEPFPDV